MQRSKQKVIAEQEAEESNALYGNEITKDMKSVVDKFIIEPSYIPIKKLVIGRVSYGGMNPEVEKFMENPVKAEEPKGKMEADVNDMEMASHFRLAKTMNKKFAGGKVTKKQTNTKLKFIKPNEE